ncbi:MAG: hypothetical protein ACKVK4_08580 [Flavobacteriales bacterium]
MVETESSLIKKHRKFLIDNKDEFLIIDLGRPVPVFKYFISNKSTWESSTVMHKTEWLLGQIAGAHKDLQEDLLRRMLTDAGQRMRNISKGGVISNDGYDYIVEKAIELKDVTEVKPNGKIQLLKNPYFNWSKWNVDFEDRSGLYRYNLNLAINKGITDVNYETIEIAMIDYDLNQKKMTKVILKDITGLGSTTIKKYLNKYPELNYIYESIKRNSGTAKQMKQKEYNLNKK